MEHYCVCSHHRDVHEPVCVCGCKRFVGTPAFPESVGGPLERGPVPVEEDP